MFPESSSFDSLRERLAKAVREFLQEFMFPERMKERMKVGRGRSRNQHPPPQLRAHTHTQRRSTKKMIIRKNRGAWTVGEDEGRMDLEIIGIERGGEEGEAAVDW